MPLRWLPALPLALLAACAEPPAPETAADAFGLAVRHNIEAQLAAPESAVATLGPAPGVRRGLAVQRYQTDQVARPVQVYTRDE